MLFNFAFENHKYNSKIIQTMKIIGYSERGAMNALFYGMALDKEHGEESMKTFIKDLAK